MTANFRKNKTYNTNHCSFGGEIDIEDFNTYNPNKSRISRQQEANLFYENMKKRQAEEKEKEKYGSMTLEELRKQKIISNTDGRPSDSLTDEKWQKEFNIRKLFIHPHDKGMKRLGGKHSRESGAWNEESSGLYLGCTNWQSYCSFINDILHNIESGQIDYCYYIYQITELTRFHHDTLKTRYCNGYWEVWLEK